MMSNILIELLSLITSFTLNWFKLSPIMTDVVSIEENQYYENDTLDTAVNISSDQCYDGIDWITNVQGKMVGNQYEGDLDLYYFNIMSEYDVSITLNIYSTISSIDCSIIYLDYYDVIDNVVAKNTYSTVYENKESNAILDNHSKEYNGRLQPGMYVIILNRQQNETVINDIDYLLHCTFSNATVLESVYIPDLRYNKNLLGALWVSDFVPFDDKTLIGQSQNIYFYSSGDQYNNTIDHMLMNMYKDNPDRAMLAAKYYIWDNELIKVLHDIFTDIYDKTATEVSDYEKVKLEVDVQMHNLNQTIEVVTTISWASDLFSPSQTIKTIVKVGSSIMTNIAAPVLGYLIQSQLPKDYVDKNIYYEAMENLVNVTTNWGYGVLCIPIYYKIVTEGNKGIPNTVKYYITYNATYDIISSSVNFLHDSSYLYNISEDYYTYSGKIYGLENYGMITDQLKLYSECVNIIRNPIVMSSLGNVDSMHEGDYKWLLFEADSADTYHFVFKCESQYEVQIFNEVAVAYGEENIICKYTPSQTEPIEEVNDDGVLLVGQYNVTYVIVKTQPGQKLYFRICGSNFDDMNALVYGIYDEHQNYIHDHVYCKYTWFDTTKHLSTCLCGYGQLLGHMKKPNSSYCLLCKGNCSIGFNPAPLNDEEESGD